MGWNYPCSCTSPSISTNSAPQCKFSILIALKKFTEIVSPYVMDVCLKRGYGSNSRWLLYIFFLHWFGSFLAKRSNWLTLFVKRQPLGVLSHILTYLQVLLLTQLVYIWIYIIGTIGFINCISWCEKVIIFFTVVRILKYLSTLLWFSNRS